MTAPQGSGSVVSGSVVSSVSTVSTADVAWGVEGAFEVRVSDSDVVSGIVPVVAPVVDEGAGVAVEDGVAGPEVDVVGRGVVGTVVDVGSAVVEVAFLVAFLVLLQVQQFEQLLVAAAAARAEVEA